MGGVHPHSCLRPSAFASLRRRAGGERSGGRRASRTPPPAPRGPVPCGRCRPPGRRGEAHGASAGRPCLPGPLGARPRPVSPRARPREALLPAPWVAFRDLWGRCPCGPGVDSSWGGGSRFHLRRPRLRGSGCGAGAGSAGTKTSARPLDVSRDGVSASASHLGSGVQESRGRSSPPPRTFSQNSSSADLGVFSTRAPWGHSLVPVPAPPPATSFCLISRPASGFRPVGVRCSSLTGHCPDSPAFPSPWSLRRLGQRYVCHVEYSETAIKQLVTHTGHSLAPPPGLKVHSFHH